jgi:predicted DNA-binding transcriptional regulator YafY
MLPPLMFAEEELEALALGSRFVIQRGDPRLALAAKNAMARIGAVLPPDLRAQLDTSGLLIGPAMDAAISPIDLAEVREAIRAEKKLAITYRDGAGAQTRRTIWPIALGFFERLRVVVAWCEVRQGFRHFRTDRIIALTPVTERYPRRRQVLLKEWRAAEGIPDRDAETSTTAIN